MFYFHLERTVIEEMNVYFYLHLLFKIEIFYVYTENKKYFLQLLTRIKHQPNIFNTRILSWSGFIFPYFIIFFSILHQFFLFIFRKTIISFATIMLLFLLFFFFRPKKIILFFPEMQVTKKIFTQAAAKKTHFINLIKFFK